MTSKSLFKQSLSQDMRQGDAYYNRMTDKSSAIRNFAGEPAVIEWRKPARCRSAVRRGG